MNSLIFQNNKATEDIFSFIILPYFNFRNLHSFSKIVQDTEKYSYIAHINDLKYEIDENFIQHHTNIVGCRRKIIYRVDLPERANFESDERYREEIIHCCGQKIQFFHNQFFDMIKLKKLKYLTFPRHPGYSREDLEELLKKKFKYLNLGLIVPTIDCADLINCFSDDYKSKVDICGPKVDDLLHNLIEFRFTGGQGITDDFLEKLTNLKFLHIRDSPEITDKSIEKLTNLNTLYIDLCDNITDISLKKLTELTSLSIFLENNVSDESIRELINLTYLEIYYHGAEQCKITDESIRELVNLRSLKVQSCELITDESIIELINLKNLSMYNCQNITGKVIERLHLKSFDSHGDNISDENLEKMTELETLIFTSPTNITYKSIGNLINLKCLRQNGRSRVIRQDEATIDANLGKLINLKTLILENCDVSDETIEKLINLEKLRIYNCNNISIKSIEKLNKLKYLKVEACEKIYDVYSASIVKSLPNLWLDELSIEKTRWLLI